MNQCELHEIAMPADLSFREQPSMIGLSAWYAVHVKSRHEFVAFHELNGKHIEAFLPTVTKISRWKDRRKLVEHPLFPGYVFVHVLPHPEAFLSVLTSRGVVTFISLEPGRPTPVAPEEIASLRLLIDSGKEIDIYPHLQKGTRVRVKSGPLKNAEGVLCIKENNHLFLVNVELLGRSVAVKISAQEIETV